MQLTTTAIEEWSSISSLNNINNIVLLCSLKKDCVYLYSLKRLCLHEQLTLAAPGLYINYLYQSRRDLSLYQHKNTQTCYSPCFIFPSENKWS